MVHLVFILISFFLCGVSRALFFPKYEGNYLHRIQYFLFVRGLSFTPAPTFRQPSSYHHSYSPLLTQSSLRFLVCPRESSRPLCFLTLHTAQNYRMNRYLMVLCWTATSAFVVRPEKSAKHWQLFSSVQETPVPTSTFNLTTALFCAGLAFDSYTEPPKESSRWERGVRVWSLLYLSYS